MCMRTMTTGVSAALDTSIVQLTQLSILKGAFESAPTAMAPAFASPAPATSSFSAANTNTSWLNAANGRLSPRPPVTATHESRASKLPRAQSPLPRPQSSQSSRVHSPSQNADWDTDAAWDAPTKSPAAPSHSPSNTAVLSKEDKAAEMARRKEERKQVCGE